LVTLENRVRSVAVVPVVSVSASVKALRPDAWPLGYSG
jgi:hypothetical protein